VIVPQFAPASTQVLGVQPQRFNTPPPEHVFGSAQVPQSSRLPHPSDIDPHSAFPAAHVVFVQPQEFGTPPPPQVSRPLHVPQSRRPPHPSSISPQLAAAASQFVGMQASVSVAGVVSGVEGTSLDAEQAERSAHDPKMKANREFMLRAYHPCVLREILPLGQIRPRGWPHSATSAR